MFGESFSTPIQAIQTSTAKVDVHARALASGQIDTDDIIGIIQGRRSLEANVATIKVADQMVGSLLDVLA
jgi:hypothetical protein